ncbi:U-Kazal-Dg21.2 [Pieris napi]|nr:U-Kazal-Dg21.2 [Pieris napi]
MIYAVVLTILMSSSIIDGKKCDIVCPDDGEMICTFDIHNKIYKMFPNDCAMAGYAQCHQVDFVRTPMKFCIKEHFVSARRVYGESCPVFCPSHYSPVCGASKYRGYNYRTFNNGCYLDMINCRGDDDYEGYVEVPLSFCQRHLMKNIFKEKITVSNIYDYRDYD